MDPTGTSSRTLEETLGRLAEHLSDYGAFLRALGRFERDGGLPESDEAWRELLEPAEKTLTQEQLVVVQGALRQLPEVLARARQAATLSAREKVDLGDFLDLLGSSLRRAVEP